MKKFLLQLGVLLALASSGLAQRTIQNTTYSSGDTETIYDATSITAGTAVTVSSGAVITYQSAGTVYLEPGFDAQPGSSFHAFIGSSGTNTTFSASPTSFTYNGQSQGPTITPNPSNATYTTSGTASATNVGSYSMTVTATGSFTGTTPISWSIGQGSQTVSISPASQTIAAGQSLTFAASGGYGVYVWGGSASGNGSIQSVTFPSTGSYWVTVYSQADANHTQSNTATSSITVNSSSPDTLNQTQLKVHVPTP